MKEARARIKINHLLEEAGWRFFDNDHLHANVLLENHVKITHHFLNDLGEDFEKTGKGFVDFLLLDPQGFPAVVLEAKSEDKNPLIGKEQARQYAVSQNCRFVILSNGNLHYFWDIQSGNPQIIGRFPSPESIASFSRFQPNPAALVQEAVNADYIARTQKPDYAADPAWLDERQRPRFIEDNRLRFLRPYQLHALRAIQHGVRSGKNRFLFEMATGTGKTLLSAAVIKLFLRTGNTRRVLFLVDRLELENQAFKNFTNLLKNDYRCVIYKENRDDWRHAEIVISTVQTFLAGNRYKRLFAPDDFDLVISDEAHRSIGGNSRAVFEYFIGYKLGLTATPRDYLKHFDSANLSQNDPRELERRMLLDTYRTFGCETGEPTFRYSLMDGVREGYLVNPLVADARTEITTRLLSDEGYAVQISTDEGDAAETFVQRDFEKRFFSENTNRVFCETFMRHALRDPITAEIGKTIVFCVSQNHAAKITQILNELAMQEFPGRYQSDFAMQITSQVPGAQQFAIDFANNNLSGHSQVDEAYITGKTRVCVTVGMMTTGYDCPDLLNLCLMRPIFSPTDFIQIKGRGTRKHDFCDELTTSAARARRGSQVKTAYKMFDFFANCEYFETGFNYDQVILLPRLPAGAPAADGLGAPPIAGIAGYDSTSPDRVTSLGVQEIGPLGMRVDRMYFQKFEHQVKNDPVAARQFADGDWNALIQRIESEHLNRPTEFFTLDKLRSAVRVDRHLGLREMLEFIFGAIPYFKTRNELLEDEFDRFDSRYTPAQDQIDDARTVFKAYLTDLEFRQMVDGGNFARLNIHPSGISFLRLSPPLRRLIPEYIRDYVSLNQFA